MTGSGGKGGSDDDRGMLLNSTISLDGSEVLENLRLELRRGSLVLAVLATLRTETHGYALGNTLREDGLEIDENTLYPLLRRLESQKLLDSQWRVEDKRNKRFYRLSEDGEQVLERLLEEWRKMNQSIEKILQSPATAGGPKIGSGN